jgi:hypothetical protein
MTNIMTNIMTTMTTSITLVNTRIPKKTLIMIHWVLLMRTFLPKNRIGSKLA